MKRRKITDAEAAEMLRKAEQDRQKRITEEIRRSRVTQSPWIENRERKYGSFE